jgi:hypothetical protein
MLPLNHLCLNYCCIYDQLPVHYEQRYQCETLLEKANMGKYMHSELFQKILALSKTAGTIFDQTKGRSMPEISKSLRGLENIERTIKRERTPESLTPLTLRVIIKSLNTMLSEVKLILLKQLNHTKGMLLKDPLDKSPLSRHSHTLTTIDTTIAALQTRITPITVNAAMNIIQIAKQHNLSLIQQIKHKELTVCRGWRQANGMVERLPEHLRGEYRSRLHRITPNLGSRSKTKGPDLLDSGNVTQSYLTTRYAICSTQAAPVTALLKELVALHRSQAAGLPRDASLFPTPSPSVEAKTLGPQHGSTP